MKSSITLYNLSSLAAKLAYNMVFSVQKVGVWVGPEGKY